MSVVPAGVREHYVVVGGHPCRVWEKGEGRALGYLAGLHGVPRWTPFLDRLAERRHVIAPSLPGFPGALGHDRLDDIADWIAATLDLIESAGVAGTDLIGASVGGMLAAEVAALSRASVHRLVLLAPFGLFDAAEPTADVFACTADQSEALLSAHPERLAAHLAAPEDADPAEWTIAMARASQAAARLLWPLGDRGLVRRLHRITAPTLLLWGSADRVIPPSYARRFVDRMSAPCELAVIEGAGHLLDLDAPEEAARVVSAFVDRG